MFYEGLTWIDPQSTQSSMGEHPTVIFVTQNGFRLIYVEGLGT